MASPSPSAPAATSATRRTAFRLTSRVFWDLAIYMVGLGLAVGMVFPPFAALLGVPADHAYRPWFVLSCLVAGFLVGALNYALCRVVVGGRLAVLAARLRSVADTIAATSRTGEWLNGIPSRIEADSDDQLGATARAFNSLLDALEDGEHFRSLVRNASDVITVVDAGGRISYQTPSVGWVLGYPPASLVHTDVHALVHPDDEPAFREYLDAATGGTPAGPCVGGRMRHRNGSWRWVETVANNLLADRAVNGVVLTTRDVTDRKELEDRLRHQAFHDPLTGLPNRALFLERLRDAETPPAGTGHPLAVLFLDLDNLKTVNDNLGHDGGDTLLKVFTQRLQGTVRAQDTVARLAGDEFAVLLEGADSSAHASQVAERILTSLREPVHIDGRYVHASVSIGIATTATCRTSGLDLLRAADVAMYHAKSAGKGRYEVFQPGHHSAELEHERLRADLQQAVDEQQFVLRYQPVVDLASGHVTGFEALLRWLHPQRGIIAPSEFIPLAEESGLIVPIGRWVTREACRQAAAWHARAARSRRPGPALRMSVNVSARQFEHPALVSDIADALQLSGLAPNQLVLEITETLLLQDSSMTTRKLGELKALGVRLALDDFGTGYSSLSYLRRFPIDILKIDKSFVVGIPDNPEDCAVAAAVVQLGEILDLEVIAEGLEHPQQVDALAALGCPSGQGYHFATPLPAAQAESLVLNRRALLPAELAS